MRICEHNLWKDKKKFPKEHHVVWIGKTKHTYICSQRWLYNFIIYVLRNTHQKTMSQVFHTQMSSGKSGEQTMFLHVWEKWYNQSQVTEVCDIRTKIQAFYIGACSLQCSRFAVEIFADIQQEKNFSKSISCKKTEKHPGNWSGIVSCISLSMKRYVESQLNNSGKGKNRTRRKLKLCSLSELLCLIM